MAGRDWRWKIGEAVERLRTRYEHIGRKTGAPFLAVVYPPEAETAVSREWDVLSANLVPAHAVHTVDLLAVTQAVTTDIGAENIVDSMRDPMPGSDPTTELGHLWVSATVEAVFSSLRDGQRNKPIVVLKRLAALYPAAGPRDVMQALWDQESVDSDAPVVVLIPGTVCGHRTYDFLNLRQEFMYRGDLL